MTGRRTVTKHNMKETLCWRCSIPGTGGCSWDKSLTPVEGWEAEQTPFRDSHSEASFSYCVKSCPLFRPESYREERKMLTEEGLARLMFLGLGVREISRKTGLSQSTVARRRREFLRKHPNFQTIKENEE